MANFISDTYLYPINVKNVYSFNFIHNAGDLFIPMVSIIQNTRSSFNLTITQPGESAMCVRNYKITVTSMGYVTQQSVVDAMNSSPTYVMIDNLRLCINYTFEVRAIALSGSMSESSIYYIGNITHRGKLKYFPVIQLRIHIKN